MLAVAPCVAFPETAVMDSSTTAAVHAVSCSACMPPSGRQGGKFIVADCNLRHAIRSRPKRRNLAGGSPVWLAYLVEMKKEAHGAQTVHARRIACRLAIWVVLPAVAPVCRFIRHRGSLGELQEYSGGSCG